MKKRKRKEKNETKKRKKERNLFARGTTAVAFFEVNNNI